VFALDEVVPASDHFCFRVGASNSDETLGLTFKAPTLERPDRTFAQRKVAIAAHAQRTLRISLTRAVQDRLRNGQRLPVDVSIVADAPSGRITVAYHLQLLQPGGTPLPAGPSWEAPQDSERCPEPDAHA
jgi:hypothetical protein